MSMSYDNLRKVITISEQSMDMKSWALALALIATLSACATTPTPTSLAKDVPVSRVLDSRYSKPASDTGEVIVKRDTGAVGSACNPIVYVDAVPVADIDVAEKIVLHLPEGEHVISAGFKGGLCSNGLAEVTAIVKRGSRSSYRIGFGENYDYFIRPTAF